MPQPIPPTNADRARHAGGLIEQGQLKAAERLLKDVLKADPGQLDALVAFGVLCGMRGHDADAVRYLSRAVAKAPRSDAAQYNLGQALIRLGRHADAAAALTVAAGLSDMPQAHEKLADCLRQMNRLDEAASHYRRAIERSGVRAGSMLLSSLVEAQRRICDWSDLNARQAQLIGRVQRGEPGEPLLMHYVSDDPALLLKNANTYNVEFLRHMLEPAPGKPRFPHPRRTRQRLRIGYLCSDFRNHATSHLMAELFECHDRERFEIIAISFGPGDASPMRRRLERAFDRFVDVAGVVSEQIAKRIHALGIDVLVDLNGYIANARPEILLARPAPVQCHYLAFPGTLASPGIDYQIVDPVIAPPGEQSNYAEAIVRLPDCYQPNDSRREVSPVRPSRSECGLPGHGTVLASFNNSIKLSPTLFEIWMRVLTAVPASVLWLFADNAWAPDNLRAAAVRSGVAPGRLVFAAYVPSADHLARIPLADLLLDSFPYGAHTTASDALWMGVPVLTLAGRSFASRVGASLVTSAGLPELVMPSFATYEAEAIALARSSGRLADLKTRLAQTRATSRLFDTPRLARHLEAAYQGMWIRWQNGEPPESFDLPPRDRGRPVLSA
jgi:protein O-GlcNAc transferase